MLQIQEFQVCHRNAPVGLDEPPVFGWMFESNRENVLHTAYRLTLWEEGDDRPLWDSGRVEKRDSVGVGCPSRVKRMPCTIYCVHLTVWDNQGEFAEAETTFETGLLDTVHAQGQWITHPLSEEDGCPVFVKSFATSAGHTSITKARLYASACGIYDARLNGAFVSEDFFAPGWTNYRKRIQYQTYDISDLIQTNNRLEITVAPGWYTGYLNGEGNNHFYGDRTALWGEVHLWYADGYHEVIPTDTDWQVTTGSVRYAQFYHGETVDSTATPIEPVPALAFEGMEKVALIAQQCEPVGIVEKLPPKAILHTPKGETVLDFRQNLSGVVEFSVEGVRGQRIVLRHAEVLDREGNFYTENLRTARATDTFICKGGKEVFRPRFTYHGFRYVQVEGMGEEVEPDGFRACVLRSRYSETARFSSSDPRVNRLWENIRWGMSGNFVDIPTDCPQRDERLGWTGDAAVFSRTACQLGDVSLFFAKWLGDLFTEQSRELGVPDVVPNILGPHGGTAVWGDSAAIVPWNVYQASGDITLLEKQYDSMKMWVDFLLDQEQGCHLRLNGFQRGDWLALDREEGQGNRGSTDAYLVASAFYAESTRTLYESAEILGKTKDAEIYKQLHESIKREFQREFITDTGRVTSQTQTAYALVLCFGLCREEHRQRIARDLAKNVENHRNHLTTGFIGTPYLCRALTENGYHDVAGKIFMGEDFPGWLREVKLGATTIWERWDSMHDDGTFDTSGMNSFNHYAFGAIGEWMLESLAGIQAARPGYRESVLRPRFIQGLTEVHGERKTPYGTVKCGWRCKGGEITVEVSIPANTMATLYLPEREESVTLGSGSYRYCYPTDTCLEPRRYSLDTTLGELVKNPLAIQLLEQAMPGAGQMLKMEFLQRKTLQELVFMSPPGAKELYEGILAQLNAQSI